MKYWRLMPSIEGLTIYSDITFDYKSRMTYSDATGKNGGIKGDLNNEHPLFLGIGSKVFSKRLIDIIVGLNLEGIEIYPINLTLPDGTNNQDWYSVRIFPHVDCIDLNLSEYRLDQDDGSIKRVHKLVINTQKAKQAGFDIFRLHDDFPTIIVSDRFKEAIEAANTKDICFFPTDGSEY